MNLTIGTTTQTGKKEKRGRKGKCIEGNNLQLVMMDCQEKNMTSDLSFFI